MHQEQYVSAILIYLTKIIKQVLLLLNVEGKNHFNLLILVPKLEHKNQDGLPMLIVNIVHLIQ